jgi:hypothetical protein
MRVEHRLSESQFVLPAFYSKLIAPLGIRCGIRFLVLQTHMSTLMPIDKKSFRRDWARSNEHATGAFELAQRNVRQAKELSRDGGLVLNC